MKSILNQRDPLEWEQFVELLKQSVVEEKVEDFLSIFLTPDERSSLGLRVQIIHSLLNSEQSQREIQQKLNTSAATVTRGSNMLKTVEPDVLEWVSKLLDNQK